MNFPYNITRPISKWASISFINNPIFIVGCGRSGTSVLLQSLGAHRNILSLPGEAPFLTSIGGAACLFNGPESEYYNASLKVKPSYLRTQLSQLGLETSGGQSLAIKHVIKKITSQKTWRFSSIRHWAAKTFPDEAVAEGLLSVYPNGKYLYIVRNGLEVVNSMMKFHGFKDNDFKDHCLTWSRAAKAFNYLSSSDSSFLIRHEHLVENPKQVFSELFNFLGLPYDRSCAAYAESTLVHPLDGPRQEAPNILDKLKSRSSPYHDWTSSQQEIFCTLCSDEMKALGYPIPYD